MIPAATTVDLIAVYWELFDDVLKRGVHPYTHPILRLSRGRSVRIWVRSHTHQNEHALPQTIISSLTVTHRKQVPCMQLGVSLFDAHERLRDTVTSRHPFARGPVVVGGQTHELSPSHALSHAQMQHKISKLV